MTEHGFVRARTTDQIEIRRGEILRAAAELVMEIGFDAVSLNGIARRAGIAKSNLYRYFDGKEEIIFQVMLHEYLSWFDDLQARLEALPDPATDEDTARGLAQSLAGRERLCHFISVKAAVLEKNMGEEARARFASILLGRAADLVDALTTRLPHLGRREAILLLKTTNAAVAGLWPMSQHAHPQGIEGLEEAEAWMTDFRRDLEAAVYYLLRGLRAR